MHQNGAFSMSTPVETPNPPVPVSTVISLAKEGGGGGGYRTPPLFSENEEGGVIEAARIH